MDGGYDWLIWLVAALVLAGVEILTLDLIFIMLAVGALAGALTAVATDAVVVQVLVAAAAAVGMLGAVRPIALRHLKGSRGELKSGVAGLVGRSALVLERVDEHGGRIKLAGEVWSARSYLPGAAIEPGATVDVVEIDGATALVYESRP